MTDPARAWPPKGRGVTSLFEAAHKRTGPLEAVPKPEPPLRPLLRTPPPWRWHHQGAATWHAHPEMHYLADPGATRPPTDAEAAEYAARRAGMDPELRWLYLLDAEHKASTLGATDDALAPGVGQHGDEGAIGYG
jgi:hypothetical protein